MPPSSIKNNDKIAELLHSQGRINEIRCLEWDANDRGRSLSGHRVIKVCICQTQIGGSVSLLSGSSPLASTYPTARRTNCGVYIPIPLEATSLTIGASTSKVDLHVSKRNVNRQWKVIVPSCLRVWNQIARYNDFSGPSSTPSTQRRKSSANCHAERSEGSLTTLGQILHCVQNDRPGAYSCPLALGPSDGMGILADGVPCHPGSQDQEPEKSGPNQAIGQQIDFE
jgi:hypothetical protein